MADKLGPGWVEAAAAAAVKGDTNYEQALRVHGKRPFSAANWERARSKKKGSDEGHKSRKLDKVLGTVSDDE